MPDNVDFIQEQQAELLERQINAARVKHCGASALVCEECDAPIPAAGAYAWNAPREAVGRERPLTRDEMRQVQGVLSTINRLPYFLRSLFTSRYDYIRRNKSPVHGFYFLTSTFQRRLWPRIERVNQRHEMNTDASMLFLAERDHYARLPGMNDKELKKFAARIPQFKTVGLPTMGAYRELRKLPRGVSIADEFDERVEAARAAADSGDFALYISAQGGANVPRDCQTVRVARSPSDDVNEYEEEVERVVGIYAPHLGARHIHITRTTDWRIVPKVPVVEPLTLKSGIAAPRSPVNNCGKVTGCDTSLPAPTPSEHAAAVLNLVDDGVIEWNDPEVVRALRGALKHGLRTPNRQQRNGSPLKPHEIAPSARLTRSERMQITRIRVDLAQNGIRPQRWELEALARGATVNYDGKKFTYPVADEWPGFSTVMEWT